MRSKQLIAAVASVLVLAGAGCTTPLRDTAVRPENPALVGAVKAPIDASLPADLQLDTPLGLMIGGSAQLDGEFTVTLVSIGDSRCKPDVQCIWEGELAPIVHVTGAAFPADGQDLVFGTVRARDLVAGGTRFTLVSATTDGIVLMAHRPASN